MSLRLFTRCLFLCIAVMSFSGYNIVRGAELGQWHGATIEVQGDFIGGYFHDEALMGSAGRETQSFKMARGLLGLDIQHESGWGGLLEYNFFPDDCVRDPNDPRANFDWYNNLGTELLYYGDYAVRNGYLRYFTPEKQWQVRIGRMVNLIGFEEDEVPFWGRVDSPHAHYITKEILNGMSVAYENPWIRLEVAGLSGRGRPDSGYNYYLNGVTDPNETDNSMWKVEGEAILRWEDYVFLSAGYHTGENGSAPGQIYSGKHYDDRLVFGAKFQTPSMGAMNLRLIALGQYSKFKVGLREEGEQEERYPLHAQELDKDGWFATGGFSLYDRIAFYLTHEELDRIDARIWYEVAGSDPSHWSLGSIERSTIFHGEFRFNRWVSLYGYYRTLDFDFGNLSYIYEPHVANKDYDRYGAVFRVGF